MSLSYSKSDLEIEARRVVSLLKTDFLLPDGSFFLEKYGDKIFPYHIYPDIGDFLPFFLYFNEDKFIEKQINLYKKSLKNGLLVSEFPSFHIKGLVKSYEYSDLILGLLDNYLLRKTEDNKRLLLETADKAIEIFGFDGKVKSFYHYKTGFRIPAVDTRDGTFIEIYSEIYKAVGIEKYKSVAYNIFETLISSNYYKKNTIFPLFLFPKNVELVPFLSNLNKFSDIAICKNNTNTLFGFLSLYLLDKKPKILIEIKKLVSSIMTKAGDGGIVMNLKNLRKDGHPSLTASFPMIDFLCDIYSETKEESFIEFAKEISEYWLKKQGSTGLFPLYADGKESFLDSETDMTVALVKLFELTGIQRYKDAAEKCFEGIMTYHSRNNFVLGVDIQSGEVINKAQRTKFISLFLKLLILMIHIDSKGKIYDDELIFGLLKDR